MFSKKLQNKIKSNEFLKPLAKGGEAEIFETQAYEGGK